MVNMDIMPNGEKKRESIKNLKTPINEITLEILTQFLEDKKTSNTDSGILREINEDMAVRKENTVHMYFIKQKLCQSQNFLI